MTLFQVEELTSYWVQHPPLHLLIAAQLGIGKDKASRVSPNSREPPASELGSMLARMGRGFSAGDVHAGLSSVILDFAELANRAESSD